MNQARNLLRDDRVTNEDVDTNASGPQSPRPRVATTTRIDVMMSNLRRALSVAQSFDDVKKMISSYGVPDDRGLLFELFCLGYLRVLDPDSDCQLVRRPTRTLPWEFQHDHGVDLVIFRKDGILPVQCKFIGMDKSLLGWTKDRLSSFYAVTVNCDRIALMSTAAGVDAFSESLYQDKTSFTGGHDLRLLSPETLTAIGLSLSGSPHKPRAALTKREDQTDAIKAVLEGFKNNDRGQMIIPTGGGKTLTALWIATEGMGHSKLILFAAPSLHLIKQSLESWRRNTSRPFDYLCVCSDGDVDEREKDDMIVTASSEVDPCGRVTTNPEEVKDFLSGDSSGPRVIFATYHSLDVVAEAAGGLGEAFLFDLAIADEAHKTAGVLSSDDPGSHKKGFTLIHDHKIIPAQKRLYMTATPKILKPRDKAKLSVEEQGGVGDMSNEQIYGPVFYRMSLSEGIALGILCDYRVVFVGVNRADLHARLKVADDEEWETACMVAARKVYDNKDLAMTRCITFHHTVKNANKFSQNMKKDMAGDCGEASAWHVSGKMSTSERSLILRDFEENGGFVANARCLTEGVNIPVVDGVMFCDAKTSIIDIIQAIGRSLRPIEGKKKISTIIVPVFHHEDTLGSMAANDSRFKTIVNVIAALSSVDDRLSATMAARWRQAQGGTGTGDGTIDLNDIFKFVDLKQHLAESLFTEVMDRCLDTKKLVLELKEEVRIWWETKVFPRYKGPYTRLSISASPKDKKKLDMATGHILSAVGRLRVPSAAEEARIAGQLDALLIGKS